MNYRKSGLNKLLDLILRRKPRRLAITHKDRLLRFKDYSQNRLQSVGVDFGIKSLAVTSDNEVIPSNNHLKRSLKKLKRLSRNLSRKRKGSNR